MRFTAYGLLAFCVFACAAADAGPRFRRPVAIVVSNDGQWLYTANQRSGSVSAVNLAARQVENEFDLGGQLSDMAMTPDGSQLLALDDQHHRLVVLDCDGSLMRLRSDLDLPPFPVQLVIDASKNRAFITSLWSRTCSVIERSSPEMPFRVVSTITLPFAPRNLCFVSDGSRLIVASSFGSALAVVDTGTLQLMATRLIPGHNIRGLATNAQGDRLYIAQQVLNPLAHSTRDDVHWGNMISNVLRSVKVDGMSDMRVNKLQDEYVIQLGEPGHAAADPGPIHEIGDGLFAVLMSGVNEVGLGPPHSLQRVRVGRRPQALARRGTTLLVANKYSDSISMIDLSTQQPIGEISLGPEPPKPNLVELGEMLFFDARLSLDGWMSCHSCHTDGHTNEQLNDNLSDGSFGAPKRVLSLLGVAQTGPWSWTGGVETLQRQVKNSIEHTMRGDAPSDQQVAALVAYMSSLKLPPPISHHLITNNTVSNDTVSSDTVSNNTVSRDAGSKHAESRALIERGQRLFLSLDCARCHTPPTYTSSESYDVGLPDAVGNARFNPPSLRGVGRRTVLMHDGQANSLSEFLTQHSRRLSRPLNDMELESLMSFLNSI